jgi:hypothetical protein
MGSYLKYISLSVEYGERVKDGPELIGLNKREIIPKNISTPPPHHLKCSPK